MDGAPRGGARGPVRALTRASGPREEKKMEMVVITRVLRSWSRLRQRVHRNSSGGRHALRSFSTSWSRRSSSCTPLSSAAFLSEISLGDNRADLVTERSLRPKMRDRSSFAFVL